MIKFNKVSVCEAKRLEEECCGIVEFEFSGSECKMLRVRTPAGIIQARYENYGVQIEIEEKQKIYVLEYKEKVTKGFDTKFIEYRKEFDSEDERDNYIRESVDHEDRDTVVKYEISANVPD